MGNAIVGFARWYWRQIKRSPRDIAFYILGGIVVSVFITLPRVLNAVVGLL
jgi:hypothetical protein